MPGKLRNFGPPPSSYNGSRTVGEDAAFARVKQERIPDTPTGYRYKTTVEVVADDPKLAQQGFHDVMEKPVLTIPAQGGNITAIGYQDRFPGQDPVSSQTTYQRDANGRDHHTMTLLSAGPLNVQQLRVELLSSNGRAKVGVPVIAEAGPRPPASRISSELVVPWKVVELVEANLRDIDAPKALTLEGPESRRAKPERLQKFREMKDDLKNFIELGSSSLTEYEAHLFSIGLNLAGSAGNGDPSFKTGDRVEYKVGGETHRGLVMASFAAGRVRILGLDEQRDFKVFDSMIHGVEDMKVLASAAH